MKKVSYYSNIKDTAEIGQGIIELNKTNTISDDPFFMVTFNLLSEKTDELFGKIKAGWMASELEERDAVRDLDVRAIFYEVEAKCVRRGGENQLKAMQLQAILNRYGLKISSASYSNESAEVRALIKDLNASELTDARLAVPELDGLIGNLEASQIDFDESAGKHLKDLSLRQNSKSATVISKELREIINDDLCTYISAMAKAVPDKYKAFADLLNVLIEESNRKIRDRIAAQKKKKEELLSH